MSGCSDEMMGNATVASGADLEKFESRALVLKALGHPARLAIVDELGRGERCVSDLTTLVGLDMSTVSRHLGTLVSVGVILRRKTGNQIFYSLRTRCVLNFFLCVERVLAEKTGDA